MQNDGNQKVEKMRNASHSFSSTLCLCILCMHEWIKRSFLCLCGGMDANAGGKHALSTIITGCAIAAIWYADYHFWFRLYANQNGNYRCGCCWCCSIRFTEFWFLLGELYWWDPIITHRLFSLPTKLEMNVYTLSLAPSFAMPAISHNQCQNTYYVMSCQIKCITNSYQLQHICRRTCLIFMPSPISPSAMYVNASYPSKYGIIIVIKWYIPCMQTHAHTNS